MGCQSSKGQAQDPQKKQESGPAPIQNAPNPQLTEKPQVIFVLGGPGAGKGTQCERIVHEFQFNHLSTGDLLREEKKAGGPDAELIGKIQAEGGLVPSDILVKLVQKQFEKNQWKGIYLIDGFPRNQENIDSWKSIIGDKVDVKILLFFECSFQVMEQRLLKRGETSGRSDDNPEAIKKRFETFQNETKPIVEQYEKLQLVQKVDSDKDIDVVHQEVRKILTEKIVGKPQVVFVLGGPGSGKGTQCAKIVQQFKFIHLSTGDLLREEAKVNEEIATLQKEGKLVSSEILVKLVQKQFCKNQWRGKYLLDGFPRNQENIDVWKKMIGDNANLNFLFFFECSFECMEKRIIERGKTSGRSDDNPESIKKRFDTFQQQTQPIADQYTQEGKIVKINAERDIDVVFEDVKKTICEKGLDK